MMKENHIFVGGWSGSGTRVIQSILYELGYFIGDRDNTRIYDGNINLAMDFLPILENLERYFKFKKEQDEYNVTRELKEIEFKIRKSVKNIRRWSIKHGELMLLIPEVHAMFPESKLILVVRNGIDNILNGHEPIKMWGEYLYPELIKGDLFEARIKIWNQSYKDAVEIGSKLFENRLCIFKLEDFIDNPKMTLKKLFKFIEEDIVDLTPYLSLINKPLSMGIRNKDEVIVSKETYTKEDRNKLFNLGQEMLQYFGYENN